MHQISEALRRARQELGKSSSVTQLSDRLGRNAEDELIPVRENIVYSRTRTVEVPPETLRARRVVSAYLPGPYVDAYKILCTQVTRKLREHEHRVLAITSPGHREGKTLTAINLCCSLAQEIDQTVLLVDADLRAPRVHHYFGLPAGPGLSDYLTADVPLEEILVHPGIGKLVVLPGGRPIPNSSELLGSQRMLSLVRELKSRYSSRIVVFDLPPVLSAADVLAFAPIVDAVLLVVEDGVTHSDRLQQTAELLSSVNVLGTVLNKSRQPESTDQLPDAEMTDSTPAKKWRLPWKR